MLILVAHRGNVNGPNQEYDNFPKYINKALASGFDVEVDVWFESGDWILHHDWKKHRIDVDFLENPRIWCHAKDVKAFEAMLKNPRIHCFWHQNDDYTITSRGFIWTYPGKELVSNSICVLPEQSGQQPVGCAGVCSDFIGSYR